MLNGVALNGTQAADIPARTSTKSAGDELREVVQTIVEVSVGSRSMMQELYDAQLTAEGLDA